MAFIRQGDAGRAGELSAIDVRTAMAEGVAGRVQPYALPSVFPRESTAVGVVLTAYVRVALAARAAWEQGRQLDPSELPAEAMAPTLFVGMYENADTPPSLQDREYRMRLLTPSQHAAARNDEGRPAVSLLKQLPQWLMCDTVRRLHVSAVGVFPRSWIEPDSQIILYRRAVTVSGATTEQGIAGVVSARSLAEWK